MARHETRHYGQLESEQVFEFQTFSLSWKDVVTAEGEIAEIITIQENKTKQQRTIRLIPLIRNALEEYQTEAMDRDTMIFHLTWQHAR